MSIGSALGAEAKGMLRRPSVAALLAQLREAWTLAKSTSEDPVAHAVELCCLLHAGGSSAGLHWLVHSGLALHVDAGSRQVQSEDAPFTDHSCFALTTRGAALDLASFGTGAPASLSESPRWDSVRNELTLAGQVVKRLRGRARNQELVLTAFQEEGWPRTIDDPLPGKADLDPAKRLRNTVQRLNFRQLAPLMRFHVNGLGTRVRWERRPLAAKPPRVLSGGSRHGPLSLRTGPSRLRRQAIGALP